MIGITVVAKKDMELRDIEDETLPVLKIKKGSKGIVTGTTDDYGPDLFVIEVECDGFGETIFVREFNTQLWQLPN